MNAENIAKLSDTQAMQLFNDLVYARHGDKQSFAVHNGIQPATVYNWKTRPRPWALVQLTEWQETQRDRKIVENLREAFNLAGVPTSPMELGP